MEISQIFSTPILKELVSKYGTPESVTRSWDTRGRGIHLTTEQQVKVNRIYGSKVTGHNLLIQSLVNDFGSDHEVTGRMKSMESIKEKMGRKNIDTDQIEDISGCRIITQNKMDQIEIVRAFKAKYGKNIKPGTENDYYVHPKDTGYEAYHATIIENGEPHEVQIRTERFNEWAETYHPIYKNESWTNHANDDPEVHKYFKEVVKVFDKLDAGNKNLSMPIPPKNLQILRINFQDVRK